MGVNIGQNQQSGIDVMAIDPHTFAKGAWLPPDWSSRYAPLLAQLAAHPGAAIAVGGKPVGTVTADEFIPLHVIGSLPSFPGMPHSAGYVTARSSLRNPSDVSEWYVWTHTGLDETLAQLDAAGVIHPYATSRSQTLDALPFDTVTWTFGFVTTLGGVLAVVAAFALLLAVEVRRRQNALSSGLATRMGLRSRTLVGSYLTEFGILGVLAVVAGAAVGLLSEMASVFGFDPAPWLVPQASPTNPLRFLIGAMSLAALVVGIAGWLAIRSIRNARLGELIRG